MSFIKDTINQDESIILYKYKGEDLKKYQTDSIESLAPDSDKIRICFVDTETTGLNNKKDFIIEIALKCIEIDKHTGDNLKVIDGYEALQDPGVPIPKQATQINGIKDEDVKGQSIDWSVVETIFKMSQLIVSHNAGFDRPFIDRKIDISKNKIWACSVKDIDWEKRNFKSRAQEILCIWHGFYYDSHRAMTDVDALIHLVTHSTNKGNQPIVELIKNARKPWVKVYAYNSKIETKDILRENKYRWDPDKKVWHKTIIHADMDDERIWLSENVYSENFSGQFTEVTPIDKYKD